MSLINYAVGVYHFLGDKAPKDVPLVDPKPRPANPWQQNGRAIVANVKASENLRASVDKVLALLGGLEMAIKRGDKVLIKPNFNSPDPLPGSTDLPFLRAVIEILLEAGAKVTIGESAGGAWRPTRNVFRKLGLFEFAHQLGVELIAFEDRVDDWVRIKIDGNFLSTVTMPRSAYEADRLVYLPCMKTHNLARFSGALKLAMGFMHPGERRAMHLGNLGNKVAEINLCWQPDLIIMDGRKAFVSGGPDRGELVEPGLLLASGNIVAVDAEAVKVLLSYHGKNRLTADPWELPQIATALRHELGTRGYTLVE
ncbi:MAG: DUF362 domain-containing protein [Chloroflexi bacterium]|nr:DUF362 domain-containing protein [Chloroflexota bacterium]